MSTYSSRSVLAPRSDRRARHSSGPALEQLESRELLATHAIADFLPLATAVQWNYSGTLNGGNATAVVTTAAGGTISGFATTRERTIITPDGGGNATTDTRYYANTVTGLRMLRQDIDTPDFNSSTLFGAGVRFVTVQVDDGAVVHFLKSLTGTSSDGSAWTGLFTGDVTVVGLENIQTSAGSFEALRINVLGSLNENGSTGWTATESVSETRWLVRGVGTVRIDYASATTFSDRAPQALRYDLGLTSSTALRGVTSTTVHGRGVVVAYGDTSPGAPDGTNYTGIDINGGLKTRVFTITNTTGQAITIAPGSQGFITITGSNAAEFTVIRQPAQTIQPGHSTPFSVRFDPAAQGFRYATVSFKTTASGAAPFTFDIRGTGILAGIPQVLGPTGVAISSGAASPSTQTGTAFGTATAAGPQHIQRIFTIVNTSSVGTLVINSVTRVTIVGAQASDFTVTLQPSITFLQPGQSVVFKISFDPSAVGARNATVSITTNNGLNPVFTFAIGGVGA